ncbi:hypothetical protein [Arthrobacter sp. QXT-31]|uniref:hypothetical protein n=1 Tax=Arthrobacter sp. QXT-31 TaxID=1357915 RepID=UPI000971BA4D|nr:hypothetical protein [Arthrobacter sp. QXT-31]APX02015.1 hypothetical protein BWQ92_10125 [Arthrobacter sp. QXT-31]
MKSDIDQLTEMNIRIGHEESAGTREYFEEKVLAAAFAMRRGLTGMVVDRTAFLDAVKPSPPRSTRILSISLFGMNRATVNCIVTQEGKQYENFRLFVRETPEKPWKLLAWANEPTTASGPQLIRDYPQSPSDEQRR